MLGLVIIWLHSNSRKNKTGKHYILPIYKNCSSWLTDSKLFYVFLYQHKYLQFKLIGDLNGRVNNYQIVPQPLIND